MSIRLVKIEKTCMAYPAQWDAWGDDGRYFYIRYRWGHLSVETAKSVADWWADRDVVEVMDGRIGGFSDGEMTTARMLAIAGMELA